MRHLAHFGTVTELDLNRRFAWRAPFSEWQRAYLGTVVEFEPLSAGATRATETLYFDARQDHLPVLAGFLTLPEFSRRTMATFLEQRLKGLGRLIRSGELSGEEQTYLFSENRAVAADWAGRVSSGQWVRLLYADGELDFPAPPDVVFNLFTSFSRYADWTRTIHVGAEWHVVRRGGVGSRFLIWEKPGDRHVMHYGTITEFDQDRHMAWRAPFAEWDKVFIGTAFTLSPRPDGGTHAYHVLRVDLPREYLPIFSGFGRLPGFDLEYETWHIHEEIRGFNELLRSGGFAEEQKRSFFEEERVLAIDIPSAQGRPRPYPNEVLSVQPSAVLTYEEAAVAVTEMLAESIPSPRFFRQWRDQARTRRLNRLGE